MKKQTIRELRRISMSIPKELISKLMKEELVAPTVVEVVEKALVDPNVSAEKKVQLQHLKDSGYLNRKEMRIDMEVQKQIDEYVDGEVKRAIKLGRIPDPKKDEDLKEFRKKIKKLQKDVKEHNKENNKENGL